MNSCETDGDKMILSSFIVLAATIFASVSTNDCSEWLPQEIAYLHKLEKFNHGQLDPSGVQGPRMRDNEREFYLKEPVSIEPWLPLQGPEDLPRCEYGNSVYHECITCVCTDELVWECQIVCLHAVNQRKSRFRNDLEWK